MTASPRISAVELAAVLGLHRPTDEQAAVIESDLSPAAVIAGAGSGKTETMATRVVWLVANRLVTPDQVLGLTFTRKAAAELGARIRRRLAQWGRVVEVRAPEDVEHLAQLAAGEPTVLTYAAYAGRLVAEQALRLGNEPDARLLSAAQLWQLSDQVVRGWRGPLAEFGSIASLTHWVLATSGQLDDHLADVEAVEQFCADSLSRFFALPIGKGARSETPLGTGDYVSALRQRQALMPLVRSYHQLKRARGAVDFGDQMRLAARLAEMAEVQAVERDRFRVVLLDEYQDTGHAQICMLRGLFGGGHPVTAVGDPFQSIYGWRGASAGNMGAFDVTFPAPGGTPARVFPLATSFRNDQMILQVANEVSSPLRTSRVTVPLRARDGAPVGTVGVAFTETVEDEARWTAHRLRSAWDELPAGERTAAVLVRRRSQMPALADALHRTGLPVEIVGIGGLLTTPEVVDVVATLRVIGEYKPAGALMRLLTGARWRIGARDLTMLHRRARRLAATPEGVESSESDVPSLVEALDDLGDPAQYSGTGYRRLHRLSGELRRLRRRLTAPLAELVAEVEHVIGVDVEVAARPDRASVGRVHLDRFLDEAAEFAAEAGESGLGAFLAYLEAAEDEENGLEAGEVEVATERVQILTVHGSKGLEWDVVAVPGLASEVFPGKSKGNNWTRTRQELPGPLRGDADAVVALDLDDVESRAEVGRRLGQHKATVDERFEQEERRLAYVAFTRARRTLLASGYAWDTTKKPRTPSAYLSTLRDSIVPDIWFEPADDAVNPLALEAPTADWPADPLGPRGPGSAGRRADVEAGAALVRAALAKLPGQTLAGLVTDDTLASVTPLIEPAQAAPESTDAAAPAAWRHDVDVLLAERDRLARGVFVDVELPHQLSVSQLVELAAAPDELARALRRPLPRPPAPWARRGTAFHAWLEQRWQQQTLLDVDELPGAADDGADYRDVTELREAFEASRWADRTPVEIEVPFEMTVGGRVVRGRMDAVFADVSRHDGWGWIVVDWKTGRRPTGADAAAAAVQLAAYRLAWARLVGLEDDQLDRVRAAFHYVRTGETVEPAALHDAEGLRALVTGGSPAPQV